MQDKYDLAHARIATGAWVVDTATGKVTGEYGVSKAQVCRIVSGKRRAVA
ncbi:hypothetical protein ACGFZ9_34330 [Streptomyces mirabilis]